MADRRPVETLVERDDGVVYAMRGGGGGADLPHDLVHAFVETELRIPDGVWGCVADGVVWGSMRHVSGRQPPHAADRSERLKKERADRIRAAEAVADLVCRIALAELEDPLGVVQAGLGPAEDGVDPGAEPLAAREVRRGPDPAPVVAGRVRH